MNFRVVWQRSVAFLILVLGSVTVYALISLNIFRNAQEAQWQDHYENLSHVIAKEAEQWIADPEGVDKYKNLVEHYQYALGIDVAFINSEGFPWGRSSADPAFATNSNVLETVCSQGRFVLSDDSGMTMITGIGEQESCGKGFVKIQIPATTYRAKLNQLWQYWLLVSSIALMVGLFLALVLRDYSIKQVENLTIALQQIRQGNFRKLEHIDPPNELTGLSLAINEMAEHLGDQFARLTSERSKLSAVFDQMTDGVLIADVKGRVELLNPAAERLFGIDRKKGLGRSVVEVLRYHQLVDLWRAAKNGQRQTTMLEIGPQHIFLQATGMPLKTAEIGTTLILFQDLTQLRRLETVRRDFISNVSHELRTPLASLKALNETLQEGALEDPPAAKRFILRMETEIDNITQLVNEILDLSRIESGKVPLSFQRIQPCELLRPAYERMELQVARAGLELVFDCQPNLPPVFADPNRIVQVIINLIHNATKATPPGGRITLSAFQDGNFIVILVKDTGIGIPKDDLTRIFERFFKSDRARSSGGTGLGLSIARHMVESHGGSIWAESEKDQGSTLYISLPIA